MSYYCSCTFPKYSIKALGSQSDKLYGLRYILPFSSRMRFLSAGITSNLKSLDVELFFVSVISFLIGTRYFSALPMNTPPDICY